MLQMQHFAAFFLKYVQFAGEIYVLLKIKKYVVYHQ